MSAPAPRLYVPEPEDPPRHDPRAFRHGSPGSGRPQGPSRSGGNPRSAPSRGTKPGGRPPQGPGGPGRGGPPKPPKKQPTGSAATAPLALRLALLPIRLAMVPLRLAGLVLGRITGGRPWLALVLVLGCGVIFLHASTLKTNQLIQQRDVEISALERSTASLRNSVAELGSTDRVSRVGRGAGMVFPDPEGVGYLDARKSQAEKAAKTFGPPSADWLPAPNRSSQNGDALNADGTPAEGGLGGTAGQAATGAGAAAGTTSGTAAGGAGAAAAGTGTTSGEGAATPSTSTSGSPSTSSSTSASTSTPESSGTPEAAGTPSGTAATGATGSADGVPTGSATGTMGTSDGAAAATGATGGATP